MPGDHTVSDPTTTATADAFVDAMRAVATSVSVVTTDGPAGRHGTTVTAFASVSADPPTVLVCLHSDSRSAALVAENQQFCLNVLPNDGQALADRFAGRHPEFEQDRFAGINWHASPGQPPRLDHATVFVCQVDQAMQAGSHAVFFARVTEVDHMGLDPLTYRDGTYHQVVPNVVHLDRKKA